MSISFNNVKSFVGVAAFVLSTTFGLISAFSAPLFAQEFRYEKDVAKYEAQSEQTPPTAETTFFAGSSTFTRWKEIPNDFAEFHAINRGFGGSRLTDWNSVATARLLAPFKPNRVVLYCGGNDITGGATGEEVVERFKKFLADLRQSNPDVKVHFCALHFAPVCEKNWDKFRYYNDAIKKLADEDPNLYYVDFENAIRDKDGAVREDLYLKDRLHLTREGETILVPIIVESIKREIDDTSSANR